jgi:hypothetical protein
VIWDMFQGSIVTVNDFLALLLLLFSFQLVVYNSTFGQYLLLVLILICMTNAFEIHYQIGDVTYSSKTVFSLGAISFNPGSFLLLILYCLINRRNLINILSKIRFGSEEERINKQTKMIDFYYSQFKESNAEELEKALGFFKDYPEEAQIALKKIHQERNRS